HRWSVNFSTSTVSTMEADDACSLLPAISFLDRGGLAAAPDIALHRPLRPCTTGRKPGYRRREVKGRICPAGPARRTRDQIWRLAESLLQDPRLQHGVPHDHQRQVGDRAIGGPHRPDRT